MLFCNTLTSENCTEGEVRLVGGILDREGRVEICLQGVWGTVCDNYFDANDARVTCRQLGLPFHGATPYNGAFFGQGTGPFHIQYIGCSGSESDLLQCSMQRRWWYTRCSNHVEDAGVLCQGDPMSQCSYTAVVISCYYCFWCCYRCCCSDVMFSEGCDEEGELRLAGGNEEGEGRVEICRYGAWGTVCGYSWEVNDAKVVCRQLGFPTTG